MKRLLSLLLCVATALACLAPSACAADVSPARRVQDMADALLAARLEADDAATVQQWINGGLAKSAGAIAEWYVFGLSQQGAYDFTAYRKALLSYLADTTVHSASSRQKYAFALLATGDHDPYIDTVLADSIGAQGVMSWIWGLHLLSNGCTSPAATIDSAIDALLSLRLDDGGWALTGSVSDVDVTAMAIQTLAPYVSTRADVASAVDSAVALLSARQLADGGFASYGRANPESPAQVLTALAALNIDGLTDPRFIKNGATILDAMSAFRLPDGGYSHTANGALNHTATAQVYYALIAYQRMLAGKAPLHQLDRSFAPATAATDYRFIAIAVIAGVAVLAFILMIVRRKRNWKSYASLFVLAAMLIIIAGTISIESASDYYAGQLPEKRDPVGAVTMSIRCDSVAGQASHIPADGVILPETRFPIAQGDTVFTILTEAARAHGILLDNQGPAGMAYIAGIANLYEFAFGDLSGWIYCLNGESASTGCDQTLLQDGDRIEWIYTLTLGNDLT